MYHKKKLKKKKEKKDQLKNPIVMNLMKELK
jgi:hypothetical protein